MEELASEKESEIRMRAARFLPSPAGVQIGLSNIFVGSNKGMFVARMLLINAKLKDVRNLQSYFLRINLAFEFGRGSIE